MPAWFGTQRAGRGYRGHYAVGDMAQGAADRILGGVGRQRGGLGQVMEIGSREDAAFGIFARFERVKYPARGRHGVERGQTARCRSSRGPSSNPRVLRWCRRAIGWSWRCQAVAAWDQRTSAILRRCDATCGWDMYLARWRGATTASIRKRRSSHALGGGGRAFRAGFLSAYA